MSGYPFFVANVFAEAAYTGNHVSVVCDCKDMSAERMQTIAWEIGPAAFLTSNEPEGGCYPLRVFTPSREIHYCGHPVLGAAHIIQTELVRRSIPSIEIRMSSGPMSLGLSYEGGSLSSLGMVQDKAVFGSVLDRQAVMDCLLNIAPEDLHPELPIQEVSTGLPYVVVPLRSLEVIRRVGIDDAAFAQLTANSDAKIMLLFTPESESAENNIHMRVFAHYYGVPEDPGTGSAGGALGAYLLDRGFLGKNRLDMRVEQGYAINRPSLLRVQADLRAEDINVTVSGSVVTVGRGTLL
ncbi:MAG: PhzF family phenazine biosynthesis protein [Alphaproteobacteria bacterium]|nr:PhzF family phenazine biosynthesis protein [Alphaproteobacteria bacterium]